MSGDGRYQHSVIEIAERIMGSVTGSSDPLPDKDLLRLSIWLDRRVERQWEETAAGMRKKLLFDRAVREMARAAVRMGIDKLLEEDPTPDERKKA